MADFENLFPGDLAPWFRQRCTVPAAGTEAGRCGPYSFDMAAGRPVVLCFYGSAADPVGLHALSVLAQERAAFEAASVMCFGVSHDADDETTGRAVAAAPSVRHVWDHDLSVSRLYGVAPKAAGAALRRLWFVLDPRLRIVAVQPLTTEGAEAIVRIVAGLGGGPRGDAQVPVLIVPGVFEPEFCARLIRTFEAQGGQASAVFTEAVPGASALVADLAAKRRRDLKLTDPALVAQVQTRIFRRVVPEIRHAFQFHATRLERLIVACYDADDGGHFAPHRDNTVAATAHRRFAVSINLNEEFEGGGVSFPEYSTRAYKPPAGGALVFSCSMMHAVAPMLVGRRYACLPFVYDDAAAALRRVMR